MSFFKEHQHIVIGQAPGRMDVMGGIADYSGSLVLQMPIQEIATVQAAFRQDGLFRIHSTMLNQTIEIKVADLPKSYEESRSFFAKQESGHWIAYILGCLIVLKKEKSNAFKKVQKGIDFWLESTVPLGKGVSSSAAIEIATMRALAQLYAIEFQGTDIAVLAQKTENLVVGAPCGLMDQLACSFGKDAHLLPILCQPDKLFPLIPLPKELNFVGIDSGIHHAVSAASYGDVRTATFMGYTIIAIANGCSISEIQEAKKSGLWESLPYHGYLCNITPTQLAKIYLELLPQNIKGKDFLALYGDSIDIVTEILPEREYKVRACTKHPIMENYRVHQYRNILQTANQNKQGLTTTDLQLLGELMYQSHSSYTMCGLGNAYTDEIVQLVKETNPTSGLYGAKITGGGSGGTVCVLCYGEQGLAAVQKLRQKFQEKFGNEVM